MSARPATEEKIIIPEDSFEQAPQVAHGAEEGHCDLSKTLDAEQLAQARAIMGDANQDGVLDKDEVLAEITNTPEGPLAKFLYKNLEGVVGKYALYDALEASGGVTQSLDQPHWYKENNVNVANLLQNIYGEFALPSEKAVEQAEEGVSDILDQAQNMNNSELLDIISKAVSPVKDVIFAPTDDTTQVVGRVAWLAKENLCENVQQLRAIDNVEIDWAVMNRLADHYNDNHKALGQDGPSRAAEIIQNIDLIMQKPPEVSLKSDVPEGTPCTPGQADIQKDKLRMCL